MRERSLFSGRIPESKCITIKNGIQPRTFTSENQLSLRSKYGLNPNSFIFISTGRASSYKRWDFVIYAVHKLIHLPNTIDFKLVFVGDGPDLGAFESLASELGVSSRVKFLGFQEDSRALLTLADCAVHASKGEGLSLSVLEYMDAGLPVLVSDVPSVCQTIVDQSTGFTFNSNSFEDLALAMAKVLDDRDTAKSVGLAGQLEVRRNYALNDTMAAFSAFWAELAAHRNI
ncbi:MAG: glycosyltransferase [Pseudomonadales bacterium]|nr:glycosyltransferase [Pseudomonadales bacterium]